MCVEDPLVHVEFWVGEREALKGTRINGSNDISVHWTQSTRLLREVRVEIVITLLPLLQCVCVWCVCELMRCVCVRERTNILGSIRRFDLLPGQLVPVHVLEEWLCLYLVHPSLPTTQPLAGILCQQLREREREKVLAAAGEVGGQLTPDMIFLQCSAMPRG